MVAFWWYIIEAGIMDVVDHKFPVPGHTCQLVDADFACIEAKARETQIVNIPSDWKDIIASAHCCEPFHVCWMEPETLHSLSHCHTT